MPRLVIGFCILMMFIITPAVKADTLVITSGGQLFAGISGGSTNYVISGDNFSISATGAASVVNPSCSPCTSGTTISLSNLIGPNLGTGTATINGTTFSNIAFLGQFNFVSQDVVLPVLPDGLIGVQFEVPFTFTGNIQGCLPTSANCTTVVFSTTELVGQGIAKAAFTFIGNQNGVSFFTPTSLRYDFREVPEPMTITLLTTGLLGLGAGLRARRKTK